MEELLNAMRREAVRVMAKKASTRLGIVTSYKPETYQCKVRLQPENTLTGWLPVGTIWIGNNWGLYCPPSPGDQVLVEFQEDDVNHGVVTMRLFDQNTNKPLGVVAGEFWIVHKGGSFIKITNDDFVLCHGEEKIECTSKAINILATGDNVHIKSDKKVHVEASEIDLDNNGTLHKIVHDAMVTLFNTHTHTGVQTGGGTTAPPTQQMSDSHLTQILKAQ